jgi:hypothetical protein
VRRGDDAALRSGREWYECRTRCETDGPHACRMPRLDRADVESPLLSLFERVALDVDATRDHLAAQVRARIGEARAPAARADREAAIASAGFDKAERDYLSGALSAESFERLTARAREDLAAAKAEAERLTAHADEQARALGGLDAESDALRRLAELRAAVASRLVGANGDVGSLRAALRAVFSAVRIEPMRRTIAQAVAIAVEDEPVSVAPSSTHGEEAFLAMPVSGVPLCVVPVPRAEMIADAALGQLVIARGERRLDLGEPLRRVPLAFAADANKSTATQVLDQISTRLP